MRYKETRYKHENRPGELPESGAIFMSNSETKRECLDRKLFGLPYNMSDFVLSVKKGMPLFLFEFENKLLYGVFRATCDGEINLQPGAYRNKFPAQVRFTTVWDCSPLAEHEFRDAIKDNYYSVKKFEFGLNQHQVDKLMALFHSKKISKNPERDVWRRGDEPAERHGRFGGDLRRTIVDRLRVVSKEDDHINSNDEKIVEVDKVSCSRRDRFKKNHLRENDDFGDSGSRKKLPGKHLDHSLVGLKREAEVGSHYMVNENKGHEFNTNRRAIRGLIDEDNFSMMEKTKVKNDIEDGYIPLYTEPPEQRYDEIGLASNDAKFLMDGENKDIMDYNRLRDEYNVRKDYRQSLSANYLGRSCDIGSRMITDEYLPGNDALETELRNLNEQSLSKPFVDVSSSHLNQDTFWTACDPTIPYIPLNPSYLASDPSFIPLESRPIYSHTDETIPSFHSRKEDSFKYFEENRISKTFFREGSLNPILPKFTSLGSSKKLEADENYIGGHKSHAFSSGITPFAAHKDSYLEEPTSKYVKKVTEPSYALKRPSSDADLCVHKEDSYNDRVLRQTRENKRVSVFARLNSDLKHDQEPESVKKNVLNASVDKVMKMLEKVASNPTNETVKTKSVDKQDDDDDDITQACEIVDNKVLGSVMDLDTDLAAESIEEELVLQETRVVDFKRRKKTSKHNTECLGGATSDSFCKRRKLVRPAFVKKESTSDGVSATKNTNVLCEITPLKDVSCSAKVVAESKELVDEKESTGDGISATKSKDMLCETTPFKDESCPVKVVVESEDQEGEGESKGEGISATKNTNMLCEIHPFKDESCSTKIVAESKEQVDEKESTGDAIGATKNANMLCEITPFKDESCSTKIVAETESKEQTDEKDSTGDGISATKNMDMLCEITPFKDESCPTKVVVESKDQVGERESAGKGINATKNTNMLCEIAPFKDESWPTKLVVESKDQVGEKESTGEGIRATKNTSMLCEITPSRDESCSTKVVAESKEQVDEKESTGEGISATENKNLLCEIPPFKDESRPTKVVAESKEQVNEKDSATKNTNMLCEIPPFKDESRSTKVAAESKEQVDEKESTGECISATKKTNMLCEITPFEDGSCSTKVVVESKEQVEKELIGDGISVAKNTDMLCEIAPFNDEIFSTSKDQMDERESTGEGISTAKNKHMLHGVAPLKEGYSMKVRAENNEQVDESIKSLDIMPPYENTGLPTFNENALFKDDGTSSCQKNVEGKEYLNVEGDGNAKNILRNPDYSSIKAIVERSETNDASIKLVQMSKECQISVGEGEEPSQVGDGNVKRISCNDDSSSAEVVVERSEKIDVYIKPVLTPDECQRNAGEGENRSQVEDRNAQIRLVSDAFVEVAQVSSKDDHKMCGWIFE